MSTMDRTGASPEIEHPLADGERAFEAGGTLVANIARALTDGRRTLETIARASLPYLLEAGIVVEVLRARPGCLVISATADWDAGPEQRRRFLAGWVEALPRYTGGENGTIVPSAPTGDTRVYTLLWVPGNGAIELPSAPTPKPLPAREEPEQLPSASRSLPVPSRGRSGGGGGGGGNGAGDLLPIPADAHANVPRRKPRSAQRPRWAWLQRRGWMLAVGLIAGLVGGFAMTSRHHAVSYSASATLFVNSGAGFSGPGSANDAEALAVSYAALLPNDQALLDDVSKTLSVPATTISSSLSASEEAGTELVDVTYTAGSASEALAGINAVANAASSDTRTKAGVIARGSVKVVNLPAAATESKSLARYGLILGAIFGLIVGIGVALVAERSDRRVDDIETLADASGANVTEWPGGLSSLELVRGLGKTGEVHAVTVMPMHSTEATAADELASLIHRSGHGLAVTIAAAADTSAWHHNLQEAPVVLVVAPGERVRTIRELTERLRLLRAAPAWSVLAV